MGVGENRTVLPQTPQKQITKTWLIAMNSPFIYIYIQLYTCIDRQILFVQMCIHVGYIIYTYMNHQVSYQIESSTDLDGDHLAIEQIQ